MTTLIDLKGKRFGRLKVLSRAPNESGKNAKWHCLCDCGGLKVVLSYALHKGITSSCGCIKREQNRTMFTRHGYSRSPEWNAWQGLKNRCYSPTYKGYKNYGGRGIKVCERWMDCFDNFLADMGKRPSINHSIERLDVNGDYSPSNCTWATIDVQSRNRRNNVLITKDGETRCATDWATLLGIHMSTLKKRIAKQGAVADVLRPVASSKSHHVATRRTGD